MRKALISGIAGFAGSHLAEYLLSKGFLVFGIVNPKHPTKNIDHIRKRLNLFDYNLLDYQNVKKVISQVNPDYVFHLAAFSSPVLSFQNPRESLEINIFGQLNLLEALVAVGSKAKILIVGSADEYGRIAPEYLPAKEQTPLNPISPYAVSKVAQDLLGFQYFLHHHLHIVRVRPFNHIGPRQSASFAIPSFAAQIAELEKKGAGQILVGNLDIWRDFTDVRDMVRAYLLAVSKGKPGEVYNIGSGKPVKIADILRMLISLSSVKIKIKKDKRRIRSVDIKKIYCDSFKFRKQTGWQPKIPILTTLSDTIDYERPKEL